MAIDALLSPGTKVDKVAGITAWFGEENLGYVRNMCSKANGSLDQANVSVGAVYITVGALYVALYIPCMIGILNPANFKHSCYKIMSVMGVIDIATLSVGIVSGYFSVVGASACNTTYNMIIFGHCVMGFWSTYCFVCIYLGINRCCDVYGSRLMETIFEGRRIWLFMTIPLTLGAAVFVFGPTLYYNSYFGTWFFTVDPYTESKGNLLHLLINTVAVGVIVLQYVAISIRLYVINCTTYTVVKSMSTSTKKVLVQSFLISLPLLIAATMYILIQFVVMPAAFTVVIELLWQSCHGGMAIIYLIFNGSVRRRVNEALFRQKTLKVTQIGVSLHTKKREVRHGGRGTTSMITVMN